MKKKMIDAKTLAGLTGLDTTTIRHIGKEIPGAKPPRGWLFPLNAVDFIKSRPDGRGKNKNKKAVNND